MGNRKFFATPILCDLSSKRGDFLGTSVLKRQYLLGISFQFCDDYDVEISEKIIAKTALGYVPVVDRNLDGRYGFVDYTGHPLPVGKTLIKLSCSHHEGIRRARVIAWVSGDRARNESL